ncbi:MAG: hypothetical protein ACKO0V_00620 [bacterium]
MGRSRAVVKQSKCAWQCLLIITLAAQFGCRTTRPEVPPPPKFAADGKKQPVGFGSAPRNGYMVDAANQVAPGISAPGQSQTSIANRNEFTTPSNNNTDSILLAEPSRNPSATSSSGLPKLGGIMKGLGNGSSSRSDSAIQRASTDQPKPAQPLDPPISLPPPPLVPPPTAIAPPGSLPAGPASTSEHAPPALPGNPGIPPLVPETSP